jgi:ribosomal protein S27AE
MAKKQLSNNAQRRAAARAAEKLAVQREKLATLELGGSPARPIEVSSASLVDVRAKSELCLRCGGSCRLAEHTAETIDSRRLRVATVECAQCGARRAVYFRIVQPLLS